jgi:hypothetical protein
MTDYSFLADFLSTFRQSPDIIKALWLLVMALWVALPCGMGLALIRHSFNAKIPHSLVGSIHRAPEGFVYVACGESVENGSLIHDPQDVIALARERAKLNETILP